jgi:hypothetical protein
MATPRKPIGSRFVIEKALDLLEQIQKVGLPNAENFETLNTLARDLAVIAPHLNPSDQVSVKQIVHSVHRIEKKLQEGGEISLRRYQNLNKFLILLKTSLRNVL